MNSLKIAQILALVGIMLALFETNETIKKGLQEQAVAIQEQSHRTLQLSILTACGDKGGSLEPDNDSNGSDRIKCN